MKYDQVYRALVEAVESGRLSEPFTAATFRGACPGFPEGTYRAFVWKNAAGGDASAVLKRIAPGKYLLSRPGPASTVGKLAAAAGDDEKAKLSR